MEYDIVIVGRGPAGIAASLYTARSGMKTIVIGANDGALNRALKIDNYFGFADVVSGQYLQEQSEIHAKRLGVDFSDDRAVSISQEDRFTVTCVKGSYSAHAVILATGVSKKRINIKGIDSFEGKGISYCTTCDGFFYRGLKTGVLGNRDYAVHEALELKNFTDKITIFTSGADLDISAESKEMLAKIENSHISINGKKISEVAGNDLMDRIIFEDGSEEPLEGLFVAYENASGPDFAKKLGVLLQDKYIVTDREQKTNVEGIFAAGDCTGGFRQLSTAVGGGASAGKSASDYVVKKRAG